MRVFFDLKLFQKQIRQKKINCYNLKHTTTIKYKVSIISIKIIDWGITMEIEINELNAEANNKSVK